MPVNDKQKIAVLDINGNTQTEIETRLAQGYVIVFIVNLQPSVNKLLIIYTTPEVI